MNVYICPTDTARFDFLSISVACASRVILARRRRLRAEITFDQYLMRLRLGNWDINYFELLSLLIEDRSHMRRNRQCHLKS